MSSRIVRDFAQGCKYAYLGQKEIFRNRRLWRYACFPVAMVGLTYLAAASLTYLWLLPKLIACGESISGNWHYAAAGVFQTLLTIGIYVLGAFIMWISLGLFYEMFGAVIFDSLTGHFEKSHFGYEKKLSLKEQFALSCQTAVFSLRAFLAGLFMIGCSLVAPVIGQILGVVVIGYFLGLSYMLSSAASHGVYPKQLDAAVKSREALVFGFGLVSFVSLIVPFTFIVMTPGFVVGGSMLFHREIYPATQPDKEGQVHENL